jgi:hypothetical protein
MLRTDIRENVTIHSIKTDIWLHNFKNLWSSKVDEVIKTYSNTKSEDSISFGELINVLKHSKNNKALEDGIQMELFKYAGEDFQYRLLYFLNLIWQGKTQPKS